MGDSVETIAVVGPRRSGRTAIANMMAHFLAHRVGHEAVILMTYDTLPQEADFKLGRQVVFRLRPSQVGAVRPMSAVIYDGYIPHDGTPDRLITTSELHHAGKR